MRRARSQMHCCRPHPTTCSGAHRGGGRRARHPCRRRLLSEARRHGSKGQRGRDEQVRQRGLHLCCPRQAEHQTGQDADALQRTVCGGRRHCTVSGNLSWFFLLASRSRHVVACPALPCRRGCSRAPPSTAAPAPALPMQGWPACGGPRHARRRRLSRLLHAAGQHACFCCITRQAAREPRPCRPRQECLGAGPAAEGRQEAAAAGGCSHDLGHGRPP